MRRAVGLIRAGLVFHRGRPDHPWQLLLAWSEEFPLFSNLFPNKSINPAELNQARSPISWRESSGTLLGRLVLGLPSAFCGLEHG